MVIKISLSKIKTAFGEYNNSAMAAFVSAIVTALTGNENFPLTQALLEGLQLSLNSFTAAMANAKSRDKVLIGLRNTARQELTLKLNTLAASVTFEAAGDRDKLLSSNFQLYKTRDLPPSMLGIITGFKVLDAIPTGLTLVCDGVKGVKTYTH